MSNDLRSIVRDRHLPISTNNPLSFFRRFVLANPQTYCCRTDSCSFASTLVESSVSCSMKLRSDSSSFDQDPDGAKGGGLTRDDVDSPMYSIMPSSHMDSSVPGTIGGGASGGPLRENDHTSSSSSSASPSATSSLHASSSSSGPPTFRLLPGLRLPLEICEKLFTMLQEEGLDMEDRTAEIFSDSGASRFRSVNVRGTSITDKGLNYLLSPQLRDLDIHGCVRLTERTLENLNACADRLVRLNIGSSGHILPNYIYSTAGKN